MASPLLLLGALILALPAVLSFPWATNGSAAQTVVTVAAVLAEHNVGYLETRARVGPALDLALEALEPQLRPAGLAVRVVFASSTDQNGTCSWYLAEQNTAKLLVSEDADVLLISGCGRPVVGWPSVGSAWGLPVLSAGNLQAYRSDSWTRVDAGPAGFDLRLFLALLQQHFGWTSRAVFAYSRKPQDVSPFSHGDVPWYHFTVSYHVGLGASRSLLAPSGLDDQPDEALQFIRAHARVAYLQGSPETLQQTMHLAQAQNMTNGDYVFIYLDILGESLEAAGHREAAKPWQSKEGRDAGGLQEAFQTVLIVTAHQPQTPEYRRFQNELILRAQRDFGVALNDSLYKNLVAGCFHDVLLLYIRALNETLCKGGTKRDTSGILEKMRSLNIQGVTGTMSLNDENVREMDYDLWSMADVESGQYKVVARYVGSEEKIKWLGHIRWKKGSPPLDNPPCVFDMDDPSCDEGEPVEWVDLFFLPDPIGYS